MSQNPVDVNTLVNAIEGYNGVPAIPFVQKGMSTISAAGTTQATATPIITDNTNVGTGTANQGILMPQGATALVLDVYNNTGATIKIYPFANDTLDGGAAGAAQTLTSAHRGCRLYCIVPATLATGATWVSSLFGAATS